MKEHTREALVLTGATLINMPLSLLNYYGNLLPYVASYFLAMSDEITYMVDPLWPATAFRFAMPIVMVFTSPLEHRFGINRCLAAAVTVLSLSFLAGYYTVREPLAFTLTFGATHGMAVGVVYSLTYKVLIIAMPQKSAKAAGIMSAGPAFGSLINIVLAYLIINPHNLEADLMIDRTLYFSDPSIIRMVPYFFVIMGCLVCSVCIAGLVCIYIGTSKDSDNIKLTRADKPGVKYSSLQNTNAEPCVYKDTRKLNLGNGTKEVLLWHDEVDTRGELGATYSAILSGDVASETLEQEQQPKKVNTKMGAITRQSNSTTENLTPYSVDIHIETVPHIVHHEGENTRDDDEDLDTDAENASLLEESVTKDCQKYNSETTEEGHMSADRTPAYDLTPTEMLGTCNFWLVWVCFMGMSHAFYVHVNLYKQYGQLAISHDLLLVSAGLLSTAGMVVTRPLLGVYSDKVGSRHAMMSSSAASSLFLCLMVIGIHAFPGLYIVTIVAEFICVSPQVLLFSLVTSDLFGHKHYASNFGLVTTAQLLLMVAEPPVISYVVSELGWDWVFLSGAASAALAMVCMIAIRRPSTQH